MLANRNANGHEVKDSTRDGERLAGVVLMLVTGEASVEHGSMPEGEPTCGYAPAVWREWVEPADCRKRVARESRTWATPPKFTRVSPLTTGAGRA